MMSGDHFERLLSEWLTDPDDEALAEQVRSALAANDEFEETFAAWRMVDLLVRGSLSIPPLRADEFPRLPPDPAASILTDRISDTPSDSANRISKHAPKPRRRSRRSKSRD